MIPCVIDGGALAPQVVDNDPWQKRAKKAGLSQKALARLLGVSENTVSLQLRGKWQSGIPRYVMFAIRAWERLPQKDRDELDDLAERDDG